MKFNKNETFTLCVKHAWNMNIIKHEHYAWNINIMHKKGLKWEHYAWNKHGKLRLCMKYAWNVNIMHEICLKC